MTTLCRLALIALLGLATVGCGDTFTRRPGERPQVGDAPSSLFEEELRRETPTGPTIYIVTSTDDSFQDIAERVYDDGSLWPVIAKANPDVNEAHLGPGQQIMIPALPSPDEDEDAANPGR